MSNTMSNPATGNTWRFAKARNITALCGMVLSLSALAALAGGVGSHTKPGTFNARHWTASLSSTVQSTPQVAFYLVSSEEQANTARGYEELAQWMRYDMGAPEPNRSVVILKAGSPTEEAQSRALIADAMAAANFVGDQAAPTFQVVDLR